MTEYITELKTATEVIREELSNANNALSRMADSLKELAEALNRNHREEVEEDEWNTN